MKNQNAFTALELLVAAGLLGLLAVLVVVPLIQFFSLSSAAADRDKLLTDMTRAHNHILEIGRISTTCDVITAGNPNCTLSGGPKCLMCRGEYNAPHDLTPITYRFTRAGGELLFQECTGASPDFCSTVETKITYPNIMEFTLCSPFDQFDGSCTIQPVKMSQINGIINGPPTVPIDRRFIRYRILGQINPKATGQTSAATGQRLAMQGAFWIRRLSPSDPFRYRRGMREK